jgi:hypothetical protein
MSRVHEVIEAMLGRHALRKVEIRGDCYIVIAGAALPYYVYVYVYIVTA